MGMVFSPSLPINYEVGVIVSRLVVIQPWFTMHQRKADTSGQIMLIALLSVTAALTNASPRWKPNDHGLHAVGEPWNHKPSLRHMVFQCYRTRFGKITQKKYFGVKPVIGLKKIQTTHIRVVKADRFERLNARRK